MQTTHEPEISDPVRLCSEEGRLNPQARGWSRFPLHECNLSGNILRKKKWNYWCVTSPTHLFSITLSNIDYLCMAFVYALDFETLQFAEQTVSLPGGTGIKMNSHVSGQLYLGHPHLNVVLEDNGDLIRIQGISDDFHRQSMLVEFAIRRTEEHESINVVIPWSENRFQFTSKQQCLPASGNLTIAGKEIEFHPGESFACLDFGRGVWKYATAWNWAAFSGQSGEHTVGINLGAHWTDGTGFTENGIVVDGKVIKIGEEIRFDYDPAHLMQPWKFKTSATPLIDLTFTPFFERKAKTEAIILRSEVHQMIGRFQGTLRDENGQEYPIENLVGWAEEHHARW